jgi:hypothetical protein
MPFKNLWRTRAVGGENESELPMDDVDRQKSKREGTFADL